MKRQILLIISLLSLLYSCRKDDDIQEIPFNNPILNLKIPTNFPQLNPLVQDNFPTKYGVELGEKLFYDKKIIFIIVNFGFYTFVFADYLHGKHR